MNEGKRGDLGTVSEAGKLFQRLLSFDGQAVQLSDHEVRDIVGVALGVKAIDLPAPTRRFVIEAEQPLFDECRNELNGEERIATRLVVHQSRQRGGSGGPARFAGPVIRAPGRRARRRARRASQLRRARNVRP